MKRYNVTIRYTVPFVTTLAIEAENEEEAEQTAVNRAAEYGPCATGKVFRCEELQ